MIFIFIIIIFKVEVFAGEEDRRRLIADGKTETGEGTEGRWM